MKREGKPIPGDWDGESYSFYMLCGPDSILWHGYIKGAIYELTRGRGWDINTGNIKAVQAIAQEIYNSMAKCDDLIKVQRMLVAAIVGEAVDLTDPAQLVPDAVDYTGIGLAAQLRTVDADKRLADVVEDLQLSPVTNVTNNIDTQAVADNIEAFRTTYETQTAAETAAANTRINDLIAAIQALNLACETVINNYVKCGGGGCEGTDPPPPPATEGDPPPEGWQPPVDPDTGEETTPGQPAYQNRKCKAANMLHDGMREAIYRMNIAGVEDLLAAFSAIVGGSLGVILGPIIASIIGAALGPFALVGGILGVVSGAIVALALGSPNLSTLVTLLDDNQTDLVCALYNSTSANQAINDYIQILTDQGANTTQQELLWAIFSTVAANALFFRLDTADGDAVEAALDGYTGGVDCYGCGNCAGPYFPFDADEEGWYYVDLDTSGGDPNGTWVGGELLITIQKTSSNFSEGAWMYDAPVGQWTAQATTKIIFGTTTPNWSASGLRVRYHFDDATQRQTDIEINGHPEYRMIEVPINAADVGKTISMLEFAVHSGSASNNGYIEFHLDSVRVCDVL